DHLDVRVLFARDPAELLHGSLLLDLILFLQATLSFFLAEKSNRRPIMAASLRVATFYDLPGNLPFDEKISTGKTTLAHNRTRLVKRRRALLKSNPLRNSQPETHPDDERGRWPSGRRLDRME